MSPREVHHYDGDPSGSTAAWAALVTVLALVVIGLLAYFLWYAPSDRGDRTNITVETREAPTPPPAPDVEVNTPPPPSSGAGPSSEEGSTKRGPAHPNETTTEPPSGDESTGR